MSGELVMTEKLRLGPDRFEFATPLHGIHLGLVVSLGSNCRFWQTAGGRAAGSLLQLWARSVTAVIPREQVIV
jgi:hypothetical protein